MDVQHIFHYVLFIYLIIHELSYSIIPYSFGIYILTRYGCSTIFTLYCLFISLYLIIHGLNYIIIPYSFACLKKMPNACDVVPRQLLERLLNLKGFWVRGLGRLEELICPSGIHKQPSLARRLKGHFHVN